MKKWVKVVLALVLTAAMATIAGYWHYSPYLVLQGMQSAFVSLDADRFNRHVDYPALRQNLKAELAGRSSGGLPMALAIIQEVVGEDLGSASPDGFIDTMLQPESVAYAMDMGKSLGLTPENLNQSTSGGADWSLERESASKVVAYIRDEGQEAGIVLERRGFADWKVTGIRWPF